MFLCLEPQCSLSFLLSIGHFILRGLSKWAYVLLTAELSQGIDELLKYWLASERQKSKPQASQGLCRKCAAALPLCLLVKAVPGPPGFKGVEETDSTSSWQSGKVKVQKGIQDERYCADTLENTTTVGQCRLM